MNKQNITRAFLRSNETMTRYIETMTQRQELGIKANHFLNWKDNLIKEFNHWVIITNEFPYDAVATTSHMIATKREVVFDWKLLNKEEQAEFTEIRDTYLKQEYDAIWENLPKQQTIPGHFHLHLVVLKRETE